MNYRNCIEKIKLELLTGKITYDEAKIKLQPIIIEMNKKGKEIAKKFNQKFKPFTFVQLIR